MIGRSRHSADTITTSREASSDGSLEPTVAIAIVIHTLEEDEGAGIGRSLGRQVVTKGLDSDVDVTDDVIALWVQSLRRSIVGFIRVCENTCFQVRDLELDVEVLVRR